MPLTSSYSRRQFLKSLAATTAVAQGIVPLHASIVQPFLAASDSSSLRLDTSWESYQGPLAGPWEVWHGDEIAVWEKVSLPHCFNHYDACDPDTPYYRGRGWYRTHIPATNPVKNGRTLLHFEGAGQTSQVYIGAQLIGTHVGGYDEFVYDITDALASVTPVPGAATVKGSKDSGVALSVLCDNSQDLERSPSDLSDFSLYGGLYRHVHLVYAPAVSIETLHITPTVVPGSPSSVKVKARLHNPTRLSGNVTLSIRVNDADGKTIHQTTKAVALWDDEIEIVAFSIAAPKLWSPKTPHLYTCSVTLTSEHGEYEMQERFGLKHTEWIDHGPFKLNGEHLLLRGTQRHMDHAGYAAAQPDELVRKEMELVKKMGANFIRLGHYQQTRQVLDLCDELGILVWEEAPWCRSGIGDKQWQDQVKQAFTNTITQHYNHPCVLIWGLGNEDDWPNEFPSIDKDAIRAFMTEMNDLAHRLDPSRTTSFRRCDFARDIPDTYSPSIWAGWYSGLYTEYQKSLETQREKSRHLLHIEWGADSHARRHSEDPYAGLPKIETGKGTAEVGMAYLQTGGNARISRDGDWSETYACDLFDWHLKVQETLPWFAGSAQWIFKDFTTPLRAENPVPRINQKGLLERDLTLKESYFVFQSYWSEEPMTHIYGHTWPVRWGAEGEQRMVKVYSNCPSAELFINGKSAGTQQRDSQNFPAAGLRWMVNFAPGKNHLRVVAKKNDVTVTDEIEFEYQTTKWDKPARLQLRELSRDDGKATVEATLLDANGVLCLDSRATVRFSLAGSGKLIDNLGTSTGSRVVQMYNGRAQISLQRNNGANTVAVVTEGIAPASVSIA
jgi:beta-galactosidase